jgi:hypothetical protein
MKQTAVDAYEQKSRELIHLYVNGDIDVRELLTSHHNIYYDIKQMEKEQIINAFDEGQEYEYQVFVNSAPRFFSDTYYNETYGSKGSDEIKIN